MPSRLSMVAEVAPGSVGAEVGVYRGDFAAAVLLFPVRRLYLVDPWAKPEGNFKLDPWADHDHEGNYGFVLKRFISEVANGRVDILRMRSLEASRALTRQGVQLDWVFIDACHAYDDCLADLVHWSALVKPGGTIFGHDLVDDCEDLKQFGVRSAVQTFCNANGWYLDTVGCEWPPSYALKRV